MIGYTHIITGPPLCGKFGYVFMRKERDLDVKIVKIDCMYYFTVNAFICELIDQLAGYLEKSVQQSSLSSSALKNKKKSSSQVM